MVSFASTMHSRPKSQRKHVPSSGATRAAIPKIAAHGLALSSASLTIRTNRFARQPTRRRCTLRLMNWWGKASGSRARVSAAFPSRFPHPDDPGDTGWHVDASYPPDGSADSYFDWRINVYSKGRALLMLFLFSDVGEDDAPTRIRVGSHLGVARILSRAGEQGLSMLQLSRAADGLTAGMPEATATGSAGTVYLCHPFLVHAAQPHRGVVPRFMAQPPLYPRAPFELTRSDGTWSPVEAAIRIGTGTANPPA